MSENKPIAKRSLRSRFEEFVLTLPEVQSIDSLVVGRPRENNERADYLAENSTLVIELKTLESDTEWKVEKILEPHRSRDEFPIFYDRWDLSKTLKHLSDGDEILARIIQSVTASVRGIFRKANSQIGRTKDTFQLPDSQGLLIILNESVEILTPDALYKALQKIAHNKKEDGKYRYNEVRAVLLISEAHGKVLPGHVLGYPVCLMPFDNGEPFAHDGFVHRLNAAWANFNGVPLVREEREMKFINDIDFDRLSFLNDAYKTEGPRHEGWARYYNRRNPYFRRFEDDRLRWFFRIIFIEIGRGFIKGGTQEESDRGKFFWMEVFTHFMEEVKHRGMDIRYFTSDEEVWRELDDLMERRFSDFERPERKWVEQWLVKTKQKGVI